MGIKLGSPPAPSLAVIGPHPAFAGIDPDGHPRNIPHRVYNLDLDDLLAGRGYDAARLCGWRYVARSDDGRNHVVEIAVDEATDTHELGFVNSGDHVDNLVALHDDAPPSVLDEDYELSVLRVPACYVLAIWFAGVDHDRDFLVPLAPVHGDFAPNCEYEASEFLTLLRETARGMAGGSAPRPTGSGDDLTRIEGIGPRIAELLASGGISTFERLAGSTPAELAGILRGGGARFNRADPTTWPEQSALAAAGRRRELEELQQRLTGGRS